MTWKHTFNRKFKQKPDQPIPAGTATKHTKILKQHIQQCLKACLQQDDVDGEEPPARTSTQDMGIRRWKPRSASWHPRVARARSKFSCQF